jgi:hypothetical protein
MHTKKTTCGGANRDPIPLFEWTWDALGKHHLPKKFNMGFGIGHTVQEHPDREKWGSKVYPNSRKHPSTFLPGPPAGAPWTPWRALLFSLPPRPVTRGTNSARGRSIPTSAPGSRTCNTERLRMAGTYRVAGSRPVPKLRAPCFSSIPRNKLGSAVAGCPRNQPWKNWERTDMFHLKPRNRFLSKSSL